MSARSLGGMVVLLMSLSAVGRDCLNPRLLPSLSVPWPCRRPPSTVVSARICCTAVAAAENRGRVALFADEDTTWCGPNSGTKTRGKDASVIARYVLCRVIMEMM